MVVDERADRIFQALGDPTRREIVALVLAGDRSVSDLAALFPMSFAAVQKHVAVLERAGLVTKQRRGREQRVSGNPAALQEVRRRLDELESRWRGRVDRIGALLDAADLAPTLGPGPAPAGPAEQTQAETNPHAEGATP